MSSEFNAGLISGVLATAFGLVLTMAWELWRERRQEAIRAKAICRALLHELDENLAILAENRRRLESEQTLVAADSFSLETLAPFNHEMWAVVKANIPNALLSAQSTIPAIRDAAFMAIHLNESAQSRQRYKDTSGAMSNFMKSLRTRNDGMLEQLGRFGLTIERARSEIAKVQDAI